MKLPVYELMISDDFSDDAEVNFVALVDKPAVQRNWNAFKEKINFQIISEDKRIISGLLMLSDTPIFRSDAANGDYYVTFSKDTIFKIAQRFFKKGYQANVNLMHDASMQVDGVTMFESFISDKSRGIIPMKGFEDAPDGSWFGSFKVDNEQVWKMIKEGKVMGFSVEGVFEYQKINSRDEQLMRQIKQILSEIDFGGPGSGRRPEGGTDDQTGGGGSAKIYSEPETLNANVDALKAMTDPYHGTQELYTDPKTGKYTADRQEFQKGVVKDLMSNGSTTEGTSFFLGGAPATGKSSIIKSGDVSLPKGILVVDSDVIKGKMPEYNEMVKQNYDKAAARAHEESSSISKDLVKNAASKKYDIVNDGVGDGKFDSVKAKADEQRAAGKSVVAHYVTTDTEVSIDRARARAEKSGRKVPEEYIRNMHKEISKLVPHLAKEKVFDSMKLYDNNGSAPKLIFEQNGDTMKVHDKAAYDKFLAKANE